MGVQVRHNARLAAAVGIFAAVATVAWFSRALQTGALLDWLLCVLVGAVGVVQLLVVRDSRAPLMLADEQGVRIRRGETWSGLPWEDIDHVEVLARGRGLGALLRDGRVVLQAREPGERETGEESGEETGAPAQRYVVPLAVTTVVEGEDVSGDLVEDLDMLAAGRTQVLVLTRSSATRDHDELRDETRDDTHDEATAAPAEPEAPTGEAAPEQQPEPEAEPEAEPEFEPVDPGRATVPAARAEVVREAVRMLPDPPAIPVQRTSQMPVSRPSADPVVVARIDGLTHEVAAGDLAPAGRPLVIGPLVAAARNRARLSIEELSERTRIRPHVLECIEVDDFEPCGGDFYARGHLRTLARILALDTAALLATYDDQFASAEIEARQVFEAELASSIGGGMRATFSGPRWSLLAACVVALAFVWGAARIFSDTPQELVSPAPEVVDAAGLAAGSTPKPPKSTLAPLRITAAETTPQVVVRDRDGRILWAGELRKGQDQQVIGMAPFEVTASNGKAVKVSLLGKSRGTVGSGQAAASRTFG